MCAYMALALMPAATHAKTYVLGNALLAIACLANPTTSSFVATRLDAASQACDTSMQVNSHGYPVIAYNDNALKILTCTHTDCASYTIHTVDRDPLASEISLQLTSQDYPVLMYYAGTTQTLNVASCNDTTCSTPAAITPIEKGDAAYISLQLDPKERPVGSYYSAGCGLKLVQCDTLRCSDPAMTIVDQGVNNNVGWYSSLQLTPQGEAVISYWNAYSRSLALAVVRHNATATIVTVDDSGNAGQWTSLKLTSQGYPVIAYYDAKSKRLKVAICKSLTCNATTSPTKIVTIGTPQQNVGTYASMQLKSDDTPVISCYESVNDSLLFIACNNSACDAYATLTADKKGGTWTSLQLNSREQPLISFYDTLGKAVALAYVHTPHAESFWSKCWSYLKEVIAYASSIGGAIHLTGVVALYAYSTKRKKAKQKQILLLLLQNRVSEAEGERKKSRCDRCLWCCCCLLCGCSLLCCSYASLFGVTESKFQVMRVRAREALGLDEPLDVQALRKVSVDERINALYNQESSSFDLDQELEALSYITQKYGSSSSNLNESQCGDWEALDMDSPRDVCLLGTSINS